MVIIYTLGRICSGLGFDVWDTFTIYTGIYDCKLRIWKYIFYLEDIDHYSQYEPRNSNLNPKIKID